MRVTIDTTELFAKDCIFQKCKARPVYRHHKGCDHFIGKHNIKVRNEYHLFLDCCPVCDHHHMVLHFMYGPIIHAWTDYTPRGALRLRAKLIQYCDKILAGEVPLRKPDKEFKAKWKRRRRQWLKKKSKTQS